MKKNIHLQIDYTPGVTGRPAADSLCLVRPGVSSKDLLCVTIFYNDRLECLDSSWSVFLQTRRIFIPSFPLCHFPS